MGTKQEGMGEKPEPAGPQETNDNRTIKERKKAHVPQNIIYS